MSDAVIISLISGAVTLLMAIISPLMIRLTNKKVDAYHKEVNSKLSQLVVAEKEASNEKGKAEGRRQKEDEIKRDAL